MARGCRFAHRFCKRRANSVMTRMLARCTFDRLTLVLVLSAGAVAAALSAMPADTWWHLRAGADIVRSHHVLLTDTYSHTAYGAEWPNHEWLSQVIFYAVYASGGLPLLAMFAAAAIVAAWALVWRLCDGGGIERFAIVALALLPACLHWSPRPQALSLLFLMSAVTLVIADRSWWLSPIFFLWANCHGAVVLGFVVVTAAFAAALVDRPRDLRRAVAILAACAIAAALAPRG